MREVGNLDFRVARGVGGGESVLDMEKDGVVPPEMAACLEAELVSD